MNCPLNCNRRCSFCRRPLDRACIHGLKMFCDNDGVCKELEYEKQQDRLDGKSRLRQPSTRRLGRRQETADNDYHGQRPFHD